MTSEKIKIELFKRRHRVSMAKIARALGVTRGAVSLVVNRKSVSRKIMEAVADAIEQPPEKVFPEYFG